MLIVYLRRKSKTMSEIETETETEQILNGLPPIRVPNPVRYAQNENTKRNLKRKRGSWEASNSQ